MRRSCAKTETGSWWSPPKSAQNKLHCTISVWHNINRQMRGKCWRLCAPPSCCVSGCLLNPYHHHLLWENPTPLRNTSATAAMLRTVVTSRSLRSVVGSTTSPRPSLTLCFFPLLSLPGCYNTSRPTSPHGRGSSELAQGLAPS